MIIEPARAPEIAPLLLEAHGLSDREQAVTLCVLRGLSTAEIAQRLSISPYTESQGAGGAGVLRPLLPPHAGARSDRLDPALRGRQPGWWKPPIERDRAVSRDDRDLAREGAAVSSRAVEEPGATGRHAAPEHGRSVDLGGLGVDFKIPGAQTGGLFAVVEHPVDPRVIVEPHIHEREDELSYVLKGTIWARVGEEEIEATTGSYVWKPRGVLHTFWNPGPEPARILEIIAPAGFERFFEELGALIETEVAENDPRISALCNRYGLSFDHSWLPDLEGRFGPMRMV